MPALYQLPETVYRSAQNRRATLQKFKSAVQTHLFEIIYSRTSFLVVYFITSLLFFKNFVYIHKVQHNTRQYNSCRSNGYMNTFLDTCTLALGSNLTSECITKLSINWLTLTHLNFSPSFITLSTPEDMDLN